METFSRYLKEMSMNWQKPGYDFDKRMHTGDAQGRGYGMEVELKGDVLTISSHNEKLAKIDAPDSSFFGPAKLKLKLTPQQLEQATKWITVQDYQHKGQHPDAHDYNSTGTLGGANLYNTSPPQNAQPIPHSKLGYDAQKSLAQQNWVDGK